MEQLVIDAGIIADYLKGNENAVLPQIWDHYKLTVSAVTITELFAAKKSVEAEMNKKMVDLLAERFTVVDINRAIAEKAANILRELDISLANALVAATAIELDSPLVTLDLGTFDLVPDLKIVDL